MSSQTESAKDSLEAIPTPSANLHHPAYGTAERKAILDAIRPAVERAIGLKVVFDVNAINVKSGFAFVDAIPRRSSGAKINYNKTRLRRRFQNDMLDGGSDAPVYALLTFKAGHWNLITFVIGPTDVAYAAWWREYDAPKVIFPYTE